MATLKVTAGITNSDTSEKLQISNLSVTTAGDNEDSGQIDIATSETSHTIETDIGSCGYAIFINRDATNYVDLGFATGVYVMRLLAGQVAVLPLAPTTATVFAIANTATCRLQYRIWEA